MNPFMRKEEKLARDRKEDEVLGKVIVWFLSAVVLEFLLFLLPLVLPESSVCFGRFPGKDPPILPIPENCIPIGW